MARERSDKSYITGWVESFDDGEAVFGAAEVMAAITRYLDDIYDGAPDGHNVMTHDEIREMLDEVWMEITEAEELHAKGREPRLVSLDASNEVLVKRYNFTRRAHPVSGSTLTGDLAAERVTLKPLRAMAIVATLDATLAERDKLKAENAELRAAVRRMAAADAELTVVGAAPQPDVDEWEAKWDALKREYYAAMLNICQLAATERGRP